MDIDRESAGEGFASGVVLGDYVITRALAEGGMGRLYLARDRALGRRVALKTVRAASEEARQAFLHEARTLGRFSHPNIVTVHAAGIADGQPWLAMELVDGRTLAERLAADRPTLRDALEIGHAIAQALAEAHRHGVIHRDLKPSNVLIGRDGRTRVADFGIARMQGDQDELGRVRGTPAWMAPEQWRGEVPTAAADLWALGVVLHELITGRRPYADAEAAGELVVQVLRVTPTPLAFASEGLPAPVVDLVTACLAKDPAARPSAEQAAAVLAEALRYRDRGPTDEPPFRGLDPYHPRHAGLFFGREAETARAVERLRDEPLLLVAGPSGVGKSSFVRAGLIPSLWARAPWTVIDIRPGSDPFATLASRMMNPTSTSPAGAPATETEEEQVGFEPPATGSSGEGEMALTASWLAADPHHLGQALRELAKARGSAVLLSWRRHSARAPSRPRRRCAISPPPAEREPTAAAPAAAGSPWARA